MNYFNMKKFKQKIRLFRYRYSAAIDFIGIASLAAVTMLVNTDIYILFHYLFVFLLLRILKK